MTLRLERLELVAATVEQLQADAEPQQLGQTLGVDVPANWPMPMYDADARAYFTGLMRERPDALGWTVWYILLLDGDGRKTLIGATGALGPPSDDGVIEVGYSILDQYHGQGYATEALCGFLVWAWQHANLRRVIADTFPNLVASIRVLEKSGFVRCGQGSDAGSIRFELVRP